jgi:nicotinamide mononucleotide transporter
MLLQVVYVFLQLYGWYAWLYGGTDQMELTVTRMPGWQVAPWVATCGLGTLLLGASMHRYTDASYPFVDALAAVASLIAQWLLGRKRLESWLVWIAVDVVSIGLYVAKALYLTAGLYLVFLVLAILGYFAWRKSLLTNPRPIEALA